MSKKVSTIIKLQVPAGDAKPASAVGPALGQHGLSIKDFCDQFNSATKDLDKGMTVPVVITAYKDRSFDFVVKTPPAAVLVRKALGIDKGSSRPNTEFVGTLTQAQLQSIAETKMPDLNANTVEAAMAIVAGTARSMGVQVEDAA